MDIKHIVIATMIAVGIVLVWLKGGSSTSESPPAGTTNDDIRNLAQQGHKIQAIKWYRAIHGVGLKEAKDAVEEMM